MAIAFFHLLQHLDRDLTRVIRYETPFMPLFQSLREKEEEEIRQYGLIYMLSINPDRERKETSTAKHQKKKKKKPKPKQAISVKRFKQPTAAPCWRRHWGGK